MPLRTSYNHAQELKVKIQAGHWTSKLGQNAVTQLYSFVCTEAKLWKLLICAQRPYVLEGKLYFQLLAWLCKWLNKERTNVLVDYGQMKLPTCDCWVLRQYLPAIHMLSLSPNIPKWNPCSLPLCDPWIPCPPLHWAHGVTFVTETNWGQEIYWGAFVVVQTWNRSHLVISVSQCYKDRLTETCSSVGPFFTVTHGRVFTLKPVENNKSSEPT